MVIVTIDTAGAKFVDKVNHLRVIPAQTEISAAQARADWPPAFAGARKGDTSLR